MHLILLCGYKQCGKDTFAKYLEDKYAYKHMKISTQLKDTLKILFKFSELQLEGSLKDTIDERWNVTPRDAMIFVGTNMFQYKLKELIPNINRNFWVSNLINEIKEMPSDQNIVISDLRFLHELNYIKTIPNVKITIFKIINPNNKLFYDKVSYESETEHLKFNFDMIVNNDTNIEELHIKVDELFVDNSFE
jgi:hypothetical protein